MKHFLWSVVFSALLATLVRGHGRLLQPPARSSMWRLGYDTPVNYDDNQLFCGGLSHQTSQGGLCGICGDPYDEPQPRTNEIGGPVYRAIIVANYTAGTEMDIEVQLTANHKGFFQFRLCPVPGFNTEATKECLDQHVLMVSGTGDTEYQILPSYRRVRLQLQLPDDLTCQHCVLQWRYHAGNSWGACGDGSSAVGCGPQEEFYGCADVTIHPSTGSTAHGGRRPTSERPVSGGTRVRPTSRRHYNTLSARRPTSGRKVAGGNRAQTTSRRPYSTLSAGRATPSRKAAGGNRAQTTSRRPYSTLSAERATPSRKAAGGTGARPTRRRLTSPPTRRPNSEGAGVCVSVGPWARVPGMDSWCQRSCHHAPPNCPPSHCRCVDEQQAADSGKRH